MRSSFGTTILPIVASVFGLACLPGPPQQAAGEHETDVADDPSQGQRAPSRKQRAPIRPHADDPQAPLAEGQKPNVVLMLADNLGYGDLSVYNGGIRGGMQTPNIDRLASEGMRFTQYLVEPGCTPSRAGLMTGQYSIRNGMSLVLAPGQAGGLQPDDVTLGKVFRSVGYDTTYVGKWHLGPSPQSQPQNQGFDQWLLGFRGSTDGVLYAENMNVLGAPQALQEGATVSIMEAKKEGEAATPVRVYDREYRATIEADIAAAASKYIEERAKTPEPFFLMVGWTRPHFPNDPAPEFVGQSGVSTYADSVVELDSRTGEVLDAIDRAGIRDQTIVIWVSDNGATVTSTMPSEVGNGDNGPFRGELGDANEGSIRTAGMIRWPGKIEPTVTNEMFSTHDFLPTLAKIIGAELQEDRPYDGVDQSALLLGEQEHSNRDHLISFVGERVAAVRWKQFRVYPMEINASSTNPQLAGYLGTTRETAGFPRIFNIEADPKELVDTAATGNAWVMGVYSKIIAEYKGSLEAHPNPPAPNLTHF